MRIKDLGAYLGIEDERTERLTDICLDSRLVKKGDLFIALSGTHFLGSSFIDDAITNGAALVISDTENKNSWYLPTIKEKLFSLCQYFYGNPLKKLKVIGISGTEGKSTTAYLISQMLNELGQKSLLITTSNGLKNSVVTSLTTPNSLELTKIMLQAVEDKVSYLVMELSSIGMNECRVASCQFAALGLLKITSDHLDYHGTKKNYHRVKHHFYKNQKATPRLIPLKYFFLYFKEFFQKEVTFYKQKRVISKYSCLKKENFYLGTIFRTQLHIATLILLKLGFEKKKIEKTYPHLKMLPGRMEIISFNPLIIVDYAHTAPSFKWALKTAKKVFKKKVFVLFGAGGERDIPKRKKYGHYALRYAKTRMVTSDNSRGEATSKIAADIMGGKDHRFLYVEERKEALKEALLRLHPHDLLLVEGKGAEESILIGKTEKHYNDKEEILKCLLK